MMNGQNQFGQQLENDLRTYDNVQKITIGQGDDCTTACFLDYSHFEANCRLIVIDLKKQQ